MGFRKAASSKQRRKMTEQGAGKGGKKKEEGRNPGLSSSGGLSRRSCAGAKAGYSFSFLIFL
jgi:hypothetical protein